MFAILTQSRGLPNDVLLFKESFVEDVGAKHRPCSRVIDHKPSLFLVYNVDLRHGLFQPPLVFFGGHKSKSLLRLVREQ